MTTVPDSPQSDTLRTELLLGGGIVVLGLLTLALVAHLAPQTLQGGPDQLALAHNGKS